MLQPDIVGRLDPPPASPQGCPAPLLRPWRLTAVRFQGLLGALVASLWLPALAEESPRASPRLWPDAAFLQRARGDDTTATTLGLQWHHTLERNPLPFGRWSVYVEAEVGRWQTTPAPHRGGTWVNQWSLVPVLRIAASDATRLYMEAGIGASWIWPVFQNHEKQFASRFQFRDHLGVGMLFGSHAQWDVSLRVEHFSNAGIKRPNPGINLLGLRLSLSW